MVRGIEADFGEFEIRIWGVSEEGVELPSWASYDLKVDLVS